MPLPFLVVLPLTVLVAPLPLEPLVGVPQAAAADPGPVVLRLAGEGVSRDEFGDWLVRHRGPLMLDLFARTVLIDRAAAAQGIEVSEEEVSRAVERQIEERVAHAFGGDRARWLEEVVTLGRSERGLRLERAQAQRTALQMDRLMAGERSIPEELLTRTWEKTYGPDGRKPRLRVIQLAFPGVSSRHKPSEEEIARMEADAGARADAAYARLVAGADFGRVAREVSEDDRSRLADGMATDDFSLGAWPPESVAVIEALSPGEFTAPVRGPRGFWIVQLVEIVETPFADVRDAIEADLLSRDPGSEEQRAFLERLVGPSDHIARPALHRHPETRRALLPQDEVVLEIGGSPITRGEYATWLRRHRGEDLVDRFALWWRLERSAEELEIEIPPAAIEERIDSDIQLLIDSNFGGDRDGWVADLVRAGRSEETYRYEARLRMRSTLIAEALIIRERKVSDADVRFTWEDRYGPGGVGLYARMILLRPTAPEIDPGTTADELEVIVEAAFDEVREQGEAIVERVRDGEDFASLARQYSQDEQTREQGGRIEERFQPGQWPAVVADAVRGLDPGGVTEPIQLADAFLIFELIDRAKTPLEQVEEALRAELKTRRPTEPELAAFRNLTQQSVPVEILPPLYD